MLASTIDLYAHRQCLRLVKERITICSGEYALNERRDRQTAAESSEAGVGYMREAAQYFADVEKIGARTKFSDLVR